MVGMMTTTWTDETPQARNIRNLKKAIRGCEKMGIIPSRTAYKRANLPVPTKATNEYQQPPLWRKMINFWRPVW